MTSIAPPWILAVAGLLIAVLLCFAKNASADDGAVLSYTGSERATTGLGNILVTHEGKTHAVWLDARSPSGEYWAHIATLDHASGEWSAAVPLTKAYDNHSRPCIALDEQGFLHVVVSGHNTPFLYLKSRRPNDASAWAPVIDFQKGTYPFLLAGPDNTLWLSGRPDHQRGIGLWRRSAEGKWALAATPFGREPQYTGYGGYNTMLAWSPDKKRLHVVADVYEGPTAKRLGEHQAIVYLATNDGGKTWLGANGEFLPAERVADTTDVIALSNEKRQAAKGKPVLRLGGIVIDRDGKPIVLFTGRDQAFSRAHLVTPAHAPGADDKWSELGLLDALRKHAPNSHATAQAAGLALSADGRLLVLLSVRATKGTPGPATAPAASATEKTGTPAPAAAESESDGDDSDPNLGYVLAQSADHGTTWSFTPAIPQAHNAQAFALSIERLSGYNQLPNAADTRFIYTHGLARYRQPGEVIQNQVNVAKIK